MWWSVVVVKKLIPFLRSPVWITTGFGAKYAGPGGTNFDCEYPGFYYTLGQKVTYFVDPEETIKGFNENPEQYDKYCRDVEGELNKRFTLVCSTRIGPSSA